MDESGLKKMKFLIDNRLGHGIQRKPFNNAYQDQTDVDENWFIDINTLEEFIDLTTNLNFKVVENEETGINYSELYDLPMIVFSFKDHMLYK